MLLIPLAFLLAMPFASAQPVQLINWFAAADITAGGDLNGAGDVRDGASVREFEFSAHSHVDHTWEAVLTLAYHHEIQTDEEHMDIHEAYLFSPKLFDGATVKLGKYFLGIGRLNQSHRHDWVFTEAPIYHKEFFGNEGVQDIGGEYSKVLGGDLVWRSTVGLVSGKEFVHSHDHDDDHGQPYSPTGYLRLSAFKDFSPQTGMETGLNYIVRNDERGDRYHYAGLDFALKSRVGRVLEHLIQAEIWSRTVYEKRENDGVEDLGAYLYYERGFNRHHSLGLRYDLYRPKLGDDEHRHIDGFHVSDDYNAYTLSYTYANSEFMKARLAAEFVDGVELDEDKSSMTRILGQLVFNIGAHPAHAF